MAQMLEPGENFGKVEDEHKRNSRSMLSFARYFTPYRSIIAQLLLAMLVEKQLYEESHYGGMSWRI